LNCVALCVTRLSSNAPAFAAMVANRSKLRWMNCPLMAAASPSTACSKRVNAFGLRFAGGKAIAANAVWCEGGKLGCRFDEPLDRDLFRSLTLVFD
jgi:hypothetical protein